MSDNVKEYTSDDFKSEVVESDTPVLVDFWAEWCGPCKVIAPVVEEIATDYKGKIKFGKVNVDDNNMVASEYGVRSIPTLLIFKNGSVVIKSENGITGLFCLPTTAVKSLETSPTTIKSEIPVRIAMGSRPSRDIFLSLERLLRSLIKRFIDLLFIEL